MWTSPTGIDQKENTIGFTEPNYFKVEGFVYGTGNTTSDYEVLEVTSACSSGTLQECSLVIWNGTGILDTRGDWEHLNHGTEAAYAKYEGTNGLDATGFTANKKITFQETHETNVDDYDLLSMYINLKEWGADTRINFEDGSTVLLSTYLQSTDLNTWQRVLIPLEDFNLTAPINVQRLTFTSTGANGFYLDNVEFVVGTSTRTVVIDANKPTMEAELTERPGMRASLVDVRPKFAPPTNI
jgi:hypothetical protein